MLRCFLFFLVTAVISGCSSALKKKCESTNWFEHGKSVAMSGKRLDSDNFAQQCRKEEVPVDYGALDSGFKSGMGKYCILEVVLETGKSGKEFNPDLCDGSKIKRLRERHRKGVRIYCKPDNAYAEGAKGKALNKICPEDMSSAFLKAHSRGRVVFLEQSARNMERDINFSRRQVGELQVDLDRKEKKLARLPRVGVSQKKGQKTNKKMSPKERSILNERNRLSRDIRSLERRIQGLRRKQESLQKRIGEYRAEAVALKGMSK